MQTRFALLAAVGLIAVTALASFLFYKTPPQKAAEQDFSKEFTLVLKDYNGNDVHLYQFRRQVLVAYAWASWCTYCGDEIKHLGDLKKTYGDKIQVIAVNRAEPTGTAKAFTNSLGITDGITFLLDPTDSFFKSIEGYAMPETVFIDTSGAVVYHQRGPLDLPTLQAKMKELVH